MASSSRVARVGRVLTLAVRGEPQQAGVKALTLEPGLSARRR